MVMMMKENSASIQEALLKNKILSLSSPHTIFCKSNQEEDHKEIFSHLEKSSHEQHTYVEVALE